MTDEERYQQIDLPFYREQIAPILPPEVLDFHTHVWTREQWLVPPGDPDVAGAKYMVTEIEYPIDQLLADGQRIFPDRPYGAVCFGNPTPSADMAMSNAYAVGAQRHPGLYPLILAGRGLATREELERAICEDGYFGYKVFLNWRGDDYGAVTVEDQISELEMELANELGLIVLLHVPRADRLADPVIQRGVRNYALQYPNARIVLAHCGRCYLPDEMARAIAAVRDLENVYLDTAMVMDPTVLEIIFAEIDSRRVLFATDFPVAAMRGRRVYVMDHWVDVVLEGYPPSAYRLASGGIRATFMVYEIILAIRRAADRAGLSPDQTRSIYGENGMALLRHVLEGRQLESAQRKWSQ